MVHGAWLGASLHCHHFIAIAMRAGGLHAVTAVTTGCSRLPGRTRSPPFSPRQWTNSLRARGSTAHGAAVATTLGGVACLWARWQACLYSTCLYSTCPKGLISRAPLRMMRMARGHPVARAISHQGGSPRPPLVWSGLVRSNLQQRAALSVPGKALGAAAQSKSESLTINHHQSAPRSIGSAHGNNNHQLPAKSLEHGSHGWSLSVGRQPMGGRGRG